MTMGCRSVVGTVRGRHYDCGWIVAEEWPCLWPYADTHDLTVCDDDALDDVADDRPLVLGCRVTDDGGEREHRRCGAVEGDDVGVGRQRQLGQPGLELLSLHAVRGLFDFLPGVAVAEPLHRDANVRLASAGTATPSSLNVRNLGPGGVAPAAPEARPAAAPAGTGTRATVKVGTKARTDHRFRSQATDSVGNTSPFANTLATRVKVFQDKSRAVKQKGPWATKKARAYFGSTVKRTTRKGARVQLTARGTDFAIVATKGRDKGKARVLVDGKPVGVVDLNARKAKPRTIVYAVSFAKPGRHTIALQGLGKKNPKAKGKRVELDAFLMLTP